MRLAGLLTLASALGGLGAPHDAGASSAATPLLRGPGGHRLAVLGVEATGHERDVFNLSVGETATYFVGEPRALVHNTSPGGGNCTPVNPTGKTDNCSHCTAGGILGRTAGEIAEATGIPEGIVPVGQVPDLLQRSGLKLGRPRGFAQTPEGFEELGRYVDTLPDGSDVVVIFGGDDVNHVVHGKVRGGNLDLFDHQSGASGADVAASNSQLGKPLLVVPVQR